MKSVVFLILGFIFIQSCLAYIDPQLNAQRLSFLPSFVFKTIEKRELAINNLTVHTTPDYCWNVPYAGSFCNNEGTGGATDYVQALFIEIPVYDPATGTTQVYFANLAQLNILETSLYLDGVNSDVYVVKYVVNNKQFDASRIEYNIQDGLFYSAYYVFPKGSALISSETYLTKDGEKYNDNLQENPDLSTICFIIVNYACPIGSQYQQYSSLVDCITKLSAINQQNSIAPNGGCPDHQSSNTTSCRSLHMLIALLDPAVHCPHVGTPSTVCIDQCNTVCDSCSPNAKCVFNVNFFGEKSYQCKCKEGYTGDGYQCTPSVCTAQYQCAQNSNYNYVQCSNNLCGCRETFTWNSVNGACECKGNSSVWWINGTAKCLDTGRCVDRYQCSTAGLNSDQVTQPAIGDWNQVKCKPYGPITTLFPYNTCQCNYGYKGGFFVPCDCPSPKRQVYSSVVDGNVCLYSDECTADYQCLQNQYCKMVGGPSEGVGICTNSKK